MRVLLLLGLSLALFCRMVFADHHNNSDKKGGSNGNEKKQENKGDHEDKGHHRPDPHQRHQRGHRHDYHPKETLVKLAPSNDRFAFDLFRQVTGDRPSENLLFSPISISTAMAFLSLGAKGKTKQQLINGIRFNVSEVPEKVMHQGFQNLLTTLNDENSEVQLDRGNALFISKDQNVQKAFIDNAKNLYQSEAFSVDFRNDKEAKKQINDYVEKNSKGKIPEILSNVDKETALVLINFIFFRAQWQNPFDERFTQEKDFHVDEKTVVQVPFMSRTGYYSAAFLDEADVVSVPYKGNASALFILPKEGQLRNVETNLHQIVKKWKKSQHTGLVDLSIPKFSISDSQDLQESLAKFGIVDAFSDNADFSGITGARNMKISKALHEAQLNVHEKGTEAVGATLMEGVPMMLPPRITLNRPFILNIYNHDTRSVLFIGKVSNPATK